MIISFKYKFIFVKNYKTAGSSIETFLYQFLNEKDIIAQTEDTKGINCWGNFDSKSLIENFEKKFADKYIKNNMAFFAHMPIWLIKERLEVLNKKLNYDFFKNFYKFAVIRNPFDMLVSDYYWQNNHNNNLKNNNSFKQILEELKNNNYSTHRLLNLNRIMDKNLKNILCDKVVKYENLNEELKHVFGHLKIPFNGKLEIFKKKNLVDKKDQNFYNYESRKLVEKIFYKEINLFNYKLKEHNSLL